MELILQPLRKYADFKGRARRSEFWLFFVTFLVVELVALTVGQVIGAAVRDTSGLVFAAIYASTVLALATPSLALAFRRLHDTGRSGWWLLLALLPVLNLVLLVFYCLDGTPGPNRFGPDPKGRNLSQVSIFT